MDKDDYIQDDEELYRNVKGGTEKENREYEYDDDGMLRILSQAFWDGSKTPSVDRAKILNGKPERALLPKKPGRKRNGIVSIKAIDVRTITDVVTKTEDRTIPHRVDVVFLPSRRPAHSLITVSPEFLEEDNRRENAFKDLRRSLARRASKYDWTLRPEE